MDNRSLIDQLDQAVETIVAGGEQAFDYGDSELAALAGIATELRLLPDEDFKARLKTELQRRPSMTTKAKAVPAGYRTATPVLCCRDAAGAIEFYKKAFGATESGERLLGAAGKIAHTEIKIGDSLIAISDEFPEWGNLSPQSLGGSPVPIHLYVEDVDALARQAVAAGAQVLIPVADQFYGDRGGRLEDPYGHLWIVATHIEDVAPEEMRKRIDAMMKQTAGESGERQITAGKPSREGFNTITPYLRVKKPAELRDFFKAAFGAVETLSTTGSAGGLHTEVRIGNSMVMIGGSEQITETPSILHLYVEDADAVYERAVAAGAVSLQAPVDQFYGDREAGMKDPGGNIWYVATHKEGGHIPAGLRSVTPFLHPKGADQLIDFLKRALGAEEADVYRSPEGIVQHAILRIGDSMIEMGEAHGEHQPMPAHLYLYVEDVDGLYARAVQAGAVSMQEPTDQDYGDRTAFIRDPHDNVWFLATNKRPGKSS